MKGYSDIYQAVIGSSNHELEKTIMLCIGRVLRMGSRPAQPGDGEEYEKCSFLVKMANDELKDRGAIDAA